MSCVSEYRLYVRTYSYQKKRIVLASSKADVTTSRRLRTYESPMNIKCTLVDAMAATLAVPDWVDPVEINDGIEKHVLIGGSIGYNNPTWEGLLEVKDLFEANARLTSLISIGSGQTASATLGTQINSEATNSSLKKWMERMVADCDQTAHQLVGYFQNTASYIRFAPSGILEDTEIMNWGENAIDLVTARVASYLDTDHVKKDLERALANLLEETSSVTLGQISMYS